MRRLPVLLLLTLALVGVPAATAAPPAVSFGKLPGLRSGPPPWGNGTRTLAARMPFLSLDALSQEQLAFHIHDHLDLWVNGSKVTVPAGVGIDLYAFRPFITQLHTHDATGILHIESAQATGYTLGQFFGEWGVRLSASCVGSYCGRVHWWVNGKEQQGNPAGHVLAPGHQEIALAVGKPPAHVPRSYPFPAGD